MDIRMRFYVGVLVVLGALSALLVLPLLQYIAAAALLSFVLFPIHDRLSGCSIRLRDRELAVSPRLSASALTAFAIVAAIFPLLVLSVVLLRTIVSFTEDLGDSDLIGTARELVLDLGISPEVLADIEAQLLTEIEGLLDAGIERVLRELTGIVNLSFRVGLGLLVFVFLLYYFLIDGRQFVAWIGEIAPLKDEVREALTEEVSIVTWAVMKSHIFVAIVEGILGGIGLYVLGVPNAAFWTVVMVVVSILPAIGIWFVWAPAVAYLAVFGEQLSAAILLIYGIAVLSVVDNYLRAILVDRSSGVHPAVVLVGVIGGIYLFGVLGLFLGPVLLGVFKAGSQVFGDVYTAETPTGDT